MVEPDRIRAILYRDGEGWAAQCLEYDIGAQAPDLDTVKKRLQVAIAAERQAAIDINGRPFEGIQPAPERFHTMWEHRSRAFPESQSNVPDGEKPAELTLALCA